MGDRLGKTGMISTSIAENAEKGAFFLKKLPKRLVVIKKISTFASLLRNKLGRLAQLVQSVCLTSRGSGVRIPQRPLLSFS